MAENLLSMELEIEVPAGRDPDEVKQGLADMLRAQFPGITDISITVNRAEPPPGED